MKIPPIPFEFGVFDIRIDWVWPQIDRKTFAAKNIFLIFRCCVHVGNLSVSPVFYRGITDVVLTSSIFSLSLLQMSYSTLPKNFHSNYSRKATEEYLQR